MTVYLCCDFCQSHCPKQKHALCTKDDHEKMSISSRFHDVFEIEINERIKATEQKDHFWLIVTSSVRKDKKDRLK